MTPEHKKESTIMARKTRFVGIDIGKLDFHEFCSISCKGMAFKNTGRNHKNLIQWLGGTPDTIVALEPMGGYEWAV